MSSIFTVVLDLSLVISDRTKNQFYVALVDTAKMKMVYEFNLWIKFLFSLEYSVELYSNDALLHDMDDIQVLSFCSVVQVRPVRSVERQKSKEEKLISWLNDYNEEYGDVNPMPMPKDIDSSYFFNETGKSVCGIKPLEVNEIVKVQEVSDSGSGQHVDNLCNILLQGNDKTCNQIEEPKNNLPNNMTDKEENKTFKLVSKSGMAENVKLGTLFQQKYYDWCGKSEKNPSAKYNKILLANNDKKGIERKGNVQSMDQNCLLNSNAKFADAVALGAENEKHVCTDLKKEDQIISYKFCKGTCCSLAKLKMTKDQKFSGRQPDVQGNKTKSCAKEQNSHALSYGSDHIPSAMNIQTTNADQKNSVTDAHFEDKPRSLNEVIKLLREAAVLRSRVLPTHKSTHQSENQKKKIAKIHKSYKKNAEPVSGSSDYQQNINKPEVSSKNVGTSDENGKFDSLPETRNCAVAVQCNLKKKNESKNTDGIHSENKSQCNTSLKNCQKPEVGPIQKTLNAGKVELKTAAPKFQIQKIQKRKRKKSKKNDGTETVGIPQGNALLKGCQKLVNGNVQETKTAGKVELKTAAPKSLPEQNQTKMQGKFGIVSKIESVPLLKSCEKFDSHHGYKIEGPGKLEVKTAESNALPKKNKIKKKKKPKIIDKIGNEDKTQSISLLKGCEKLDNHNFDKIEGPRKAESKTVISNSVNQYDNAGNNENVRCDDITGCSTSHAALMTENIFPSSLTEARRGEIVVDKRERIGFKFSCPEKPCPVIEKLLPVTEVEGKSVDSPCVGDKTKMADHEFTFKETKSLGNCSNVLLASKHQNYKLIHNMHEKKKDEGEMDEFIFPHSFKKELGPVDAPVPVGEKREEGTINNVRSFINEGKRRNSSYCRFSDIDQVISIPYKITDNAIVEDGKDENFPGDAKEGPLPLSGERGYFESNDLVNGGADRRVDGFKSDDAGTLLRERDEDKTVKYEDGSSETSGGDSKLSGSCEIAENEVFPLPYGSIQSVRTDESKQFPLNDLWEFVGSDRETDLKETKTSRGELSDADKVSQFGNDSGSAAASESASASAAAVDTRHVASYIKNIFVKYQIFSILLRAFLVALVATVMYLDFLKLR